MTRGWGRRDICWDVPEVGSYSRAGERVLEGANGLWDGLEKRERMVKREGRRKDATPEVDLQDQTG